MHETATKGTGRTVSHHEKKKPAAPKPPAANSEPKSDAEDTQGEGFLYKAIPSGEPQPENPTGDDDTEGHGWNIHL